MKPVCPAPVASRLWSGVRSSSLLRLRSQGSVVQAISAYHTHTRLFLLVINNNQDGVDQRWSKTLRTVQFFDLRNLSLLYCWHSNITTKSRLSWPWQPTGSPVFIKDRTPNSGKRNDTSLTLGNFPAPTCFFPGMFSYPEYCHSQTLCRF